MTVALHETIAANLTAIAVRIDAAAARARRDAAGVKLIAVSKTFPAETIIEAVRAGVRDLGENRVQEGAAKIPAVTAGSDARPSWHLIGHLQSNKVKAALELFTTIHSVDSIELAQRIDRLADRRVPVLLEVNVAAEASKFGVALDQVGALVSAIEPLSNVEVVGLMTVAPFVANPEEVRPVFAKLRELRDSLGLHELSMGMSADYEVAIEEGSTMVRIGRAIFGERPQPL